MTPEEQVQMIKEIYEEAIQKLAKLGIERQDIIRSYIKELEDQKIDAIRASLSDKAPQ